MIIDMLKRRRRRKKQSVDLGDKFFMDAKFFTKRLLLFLLWISQSAMRELSLSGDFYGTLSKIEGSKPFSSWTNKIITFVNF